MPHTCALPVMLSWVGGACVFCGGVVGTGVEIGVEDDQIAGVNVGGGANVRSGVVVGTLVSVGMLVEVGAMSITAVGLGSTDAVSVSLIAGVSDGGGVMLVVVVGV